MGFLDIKAPSPRTKEYYEKNLLNAYRLYCEAVSLDHSEDTIDMCLDLVEYWQYKYEQIEKGRVLLGEKT